MWWLVACSERPAPPPEEAFPPTARVETWRSMHDDRVAVRHPSDGGGAVVLLDGPTQVPAGGVARWTVRYTVGPLGIAEGGRLFLQSPPFWGWSPAQASSADAPGFVEAAAPAGAWFEAENPAEGLVAFAVRGRALAAGESVDLSYGPARADRFAEAASALWLAVDGDGDGVRRLVAGPVTVAVVAGPPVGWHATLPSVATPGEPIRLTLAALDAQGNAFSPWTGTVALALPAGLDGPATVRVTDRGLGEVALVPRVAGIFSVGVRSDDGLVGRTNPVVVRAGAERILWADLQIHTAVSDGTGSLDDVWRYARDVAGLDVAAITDHDHWGLGFLDESAALQADAGEAARRWTTPGRFLALPGYEWTSWIHGHRHVIGFASFPPMCSSIDPACDTPTELWAALAGSDALTFAHHVAGGPVATNWAFRPDPRFEPVVEIASVHGQSEAADAPGVIYDAVPGTFARDALARGYPLGFVGSTDGHDGHPGLSHLAGGHGGLAAILASEVSPEAVRAALLARRTYATNGVRMVLRFEVDGDRAVVRAVGTAPVAELALIGPGGPIHRITGDGGAVAHATFALPADAAFVYARVIQEDGGVGWSSPHWNLAN